VTAADKPGQQSWHVLATLSVLMGFASISTDLYLPAMPAMGRTLHADAGAIELTVSGYLVGFSLGQLLWGPISDRYGRRGPVAIGLVLFIIGSAGCAMSSSAPALIGWRVVQAIGACASVTLGRAMVGDLYARDHAARMLSMLLMVMAVAPLLGPSLGGQIFALAGWRAIFWTLVGIAALTLGALLALPETLPPARRNHEPLACAFGAYVELLRHSQLMLYAGASGFFYGGTFAYIAGSPFAYISYYHVKPSLYGLLFGAGIIGIMATNLINARLVIKLGRTTLLRAGTSGAALAAIALGADARLGWGGLAGLVLPLFIFIGLTGFIIANAIAGVLGFFPARAGAASALAGAIQYGAGIAGSALVSAFADGTPWPMGCVIALSGIGSFLCAWAVVPSRPIAEPAAGLMEAQ